MKIAILGAGISGLSLFDILKRYYNINCDIYEKDTIGGLCKSKVIDDYVFDLSGGHVFNSKKEEVLNYVFSLLEKDYWQFSKRNSKILFNNSIVDYPFELSLSQVDPKISIYCIEELYKRNKYKNITNFKDFLIKKFGLGIFRYYLEPYNQKIWKFPLTNMDYDWVKSKLPTPDSKEILSNIFYNKQEAEMVHSSYFYPLHNGIYTLIQAMSKNITTIHIGERISKIEFINKKILVNGSRYDLVINTMPLPELLNIISFPPSIENRINSLKYNSVLTILYEGEKEFVKDYSWLYIPNKTIIPHRVVFQGNFSKFNCPKNKYSFTLEITKPEIYSRTEINNNIKNKLKINKKAISEFFTKYAYVIFDKNRRINLNRIFSFFQSNNFIQHGRFAEWTYPNMDDCIYNSLILAKNINEIMLK